MTSSNAQVPECNTPGITPTQMAAFLEEIDTSVTGMVASTSIAASSPWKISVWFYHLRYSDGSTDQQNYDPEQFIEEVNTYFDGTFEFVVCGTTNIDNDDYYQLDIGSNSSDLTNLWAEVDLLDEPLADNCVRVFLLGGGNTIYENGDPKASGHAHDPLMYANPAVFLGYLSGRLWAHELGHYFGLPHTFAGAGTTGQYVHALGSPVVIGGISYTCHQTGDGFCDTPADPNNCNFISQCQLQSCTTSLDPLGVQYNPDPTLLMGYNGNNCRNRFSGEQHQRMRTLYLDHPAYAFLRNPPQECIAPTFGDIKKNCEGYVPSDPYQTLINLPVEVRDGLQSNCDPQDNQTDALGRYLIDPCPTVGARRIVLPDRNFGNNPLNGVSTFDLVQINAHVLGSKKFENPFQMIAADVNSSASITVFDIVELRKLILGIYQELPIKISWRYVPEFYTEFQSFYNNFSVDPFNATLQDPFQAFTRSYPKMGIIPQNIPNSSSWMDFVTLMLNSGLSENETAWSFTAIKLGDVNCSASPEDDMIQEDDHEFLIDSSSVTSTTFSGIKRVEIIASAPTNVLAWQFGVQYASDSLILSNLAAGTDVETFDEDNFHIAPADSLQADGMFKAIWFAQDSEAININNKVLFEFQARTSAGITQFEQSFRLKEELLPFLFYDEDGEIVSNVTLTLRISDVPQEFSVPILTGSSSIRSSKPLRVKAYPTPFNSEVGFVFDLPQNEQVHLDIFDARGILVSSTNIALPAGSQELQITDLAWQPAGFYWYSLRAGEFAAQGKLSKR